MVRMASSEVATTIFGPLVPAAYLGSFQIQDHGIIGLVWWDWGCAALYLLVAVILLLRERLGLVLVGALSALNVTVLCYQLLGLWFEKSIARNVDPDFMVRAIVQRGMLVVALLGYSALTYFLTRLAMKRRIIALNRSGPFITIHFPSPK